MYETEDDSEYMLQQRIQRLQREPANKGKSYQELKKLAESEIMLEESAGKRTKALYE